MKMLACGLFATCSLLSQTALLKANTIGVDVAIGYIFDQNGTLESNRLPVDSLCLLVADISRNGFGALTSAGWASGDDRLVTITDSEFTTGTKGFSLASGVTEPGLFSRSLSIDLGQFGAFTDPIPLALLWFPTYKASATNLSAGGPAVGTSYGFFSRAVPLYAENGTQGWFLPNTPGADIALDPFATSELGGVDPASNGIASRTVLAVQSVPEPVSPTALLLIGAFYVFGLQRLPAFSQSASKPRVA